MVSQYPAYDPDVTLLTERAVGLIWNAYEGYSDDHLDKTELTPSVAKNIELGVSVMQRGTAPTRGELASGKRLGERRAGQGVPLESVIQAYRSTERTILLDLFSGSARWPAALTQRYANLIITTFDLLTEEMINAYRETASAIEAAQRRVENELVVGIANGTVTPGGDLDRWTQALGVEQATPWFSFVIGSTGETDHIDVLRLRQRIVRALQNGVSGPVLFGDLGALTVALARPRASADVLRQRLQEAIESFGSPTDYAIGVGGISQDLTSAHESCREARDAAAVALTGRHANRVVAFDDALLEILLGREPTLATRLVDSRIGALRDHPHLIQTLEALVACDHSQSAVAKALFVHPNTVTYRIRRIQQLTGFDPLVMSDFIQMATALLWLRADRH